MSYLNGGQVSVPQGSFKNSLKEMGVVRTPVAFVVILSIGVLGVYGEAKLAEQDTQAPTDATPDTSETDSILPDVPNLKTITPDNTQYIRFES